MEKIKKYGITGFSIIALIALFFPMATVEINGDYVHSSLSLSGFAIAFQGYICMILIVGPLAILAADWIPFVKKLKALVQAGVAVLGIILTFIGYSQAQSIAAASQAAGMGTVDCTSALGFGGILCLISYAAILVLTVLFQKNKLTDDINNLKNKNL